MENETRHQRFQRVAGKRTKRILKDLQLLGNTSTPYEYEYTQEEVNKIFEAIEEQLTETKSRFPIKTNKSREFSL